MIYGFRQEIDMELRNIKNKFDMIHEAVGQKLIPLQQNIDKFSKSLFDLQ